MQKVKTSSLILASSFFGEGIDFPHFLSIFATPISFMGD